MSSANRQQMAPLSAADLSSASFLSDIFGMSAASKSNNATRGVVKTYQCGDFLYPDVTSPLNKILARGRNDQFNNNEPFIDEIGLGAKGAPAFSKPPGFGLAAEFATGDGFRQYRDSNRSVFSTPDSGLFQQSSRDLPGFEKDNIGQRHASFSPQSGMFLGSGDEGRHNADPLNNASDLGRSRSPQSDGGYGTSFDSNVSKSQVVRKDVDMDRISELLRSISVNTGGLKVPGSPVGSGGSSSNKAFSEDNVQVSNGGGYSGGLPDFDPAVTNYQQSLSATDIQHHHPFAHSSQQDQLLLQDLQQYVSGGASGGGRGGLSQSGGMNNSNNSIFRNMSENSLTMPMSPNAAALENAARNHRSSAANNAPTCTWAGQLPPRTLANSPLSCKIFLGGVPWDCTEAGLMSAFRKYGNIKVDWPNRDSTTAPTVAPKGYLYIVFEHEKQVRDLLEDCSRDFSSGGSFYFKISSHRMKLKEVQVIPWAISDSSFVCSPPLHTDPQRTVFVGALHGMLNAEGLCIIFNDLFGDVVFASVDTDKHKYPIGSGRVMFSSHTAYMKAVAAAFIEIRTPKFCKKIQVDPYLEDALCSSCSLRQGPYFCRDLPCFKYFCRNCWSDQHSIKVLSHHIPLTRNNHRHQPSGGRAITSGNNRMLSYGLGTGHDVFSNQPDMRALQYFYG